MLGIQISRPPSFPRQLVPAIVQRLPTLRVVHLYCMGPALDGCLLLLHENGICKGYQRNARAGSLDVQLFRCGTARTAGECMILNKARSLNAESLQLPKSSRKAPARQCGFMCLHPNQGLGELWGVIFSARFSGPVRTSRSRIVAALPHW